MEQRCGNCQFLKVWPDRSGRRVVRKANAYPCTAPVPKMPKLADSITRASGYTPFERMTRNCMEPTDGQNCAVWVQYVPEAKA